MFNYINKRLLADEKIVFRGYRHWIVFLYPALWLIGAELFYVHFPYMKYLAGIPLLYGIMLGSLSSINYFCTEIAVTNIRVIIKTGLFFKISYETNIRNVASIQVVQDIMGSMLNYGAVIISDTGSLRSSFA